jgi:hypothetical protein
MSRKKSLKEYENEINQLLFDKYNSNENVYNGYIIDNILFNDKTHLVASFKDYLIMDDVYEFLKRFYSQKESIQRLLKYTAYYDKYNFLFPNYTALPESNYFYDNINKKQKIIDDQQKEKGSKKNENLNDHNKNINNISTKDYNKDINNDINYSQKSKIFDSKVYNSIFKTSNKSSISQFDIERNSEKTDTIRDFNRIITEIDNMHTDNNNNNNIIKLNDSPAQPMHNYDNTLLNTENNTYATLVSSNYTNYNTIIQNTNDKKYKKIICNSNYCYNKFKNRNIKVSNIIYKTNNKTNNKAKNKANNKNNNMPITKTPLSKNINIFFSPIYTKINIKSNKLNNENRRSNNNFINKKNNINIQKYNKFIIRLSSFLYFELIKIL